MNTNDSEKQPLLEAKNIKVYFPVYGGLFSTLQGYVHAVDDVSLTVFEGETLGLVGESGCGKSTLLQSMLQMIPLTEGSVVFDGQDLTSCTKKELQKVRKDFQIVYQDPFSSLNPRMSIREIVSEPVLVHGTQSSEEREELLRQTIRDVGLDESALEKYPHEFSGGQRQRVCIARAIILRPKLILCDEPVSALDVSIQSQILNLLRDMKEKYGLTYIFVSHALNVVRFLSDRICVMYLGKVMEIADKEEFFSHAMHPYSRALLSAIPVPDPDAHRERIVLRGDVASPKNLPSGCRFHTRCPMAVERCSEEEPELREVRPGHFCACFLEDDCVSEATP